MGVRGEEEVTVMRRALGRFVASTGLVSVLAVGALTVSVVSASAAGSCPNEQFRTGYSAALPDCRAYELVSPPSVQPFFETFGEVVNVKFGLRPIGAEKSTFASQSSADSGLAFFTTFAPPGSTTDGPFFLASRGPGGWSTQNLIPPQQTESGPACLPTMIGWSANLERGVLADGFTSPATTCGADEPELVPGEPRGVQNLFLRDSSTGSYQLIDQPSLSGSPATAVYQSGSSDLGVIAFSEAAKLTPEAPALVPGNLNSTDDYVWAGGRVDRLLTVLPNGEATEGNIANSVELFGTADRSPTFSHAVAPDGSRIEFTAGGNLYTRINPGAAQSAFDEAGACDEPSKACTVQIDASQTAEPGGGGVFAEAGGESGGVVYFSDTNRLTSDSTAQAGEPDLYEYDFRKPAAERLTDLTVDQNAGQPANVLGIVGTNETGPPGGYVYFVATGVLASNANSDGAVATPGMPNLYLAHGGSKGFVATLSLAEDSCDWENGCMTARVSANGRYVGFDSLERLTGFDNTPHVPADCVSLLPGSGVTPAPCQEIFLYDAEDEILSCASCGTGAPTAPASIRQPEDAFVKIPIPFYLQRNVSDDGQVFFDTQSPLVEAARNGQSNVYEYQSGQLHLLSSGTAEAPSYFYEASSDGGDVYLVSQQALTPGASSAELAIFDAKFDGGFPQPASATSDPCAGEACSGAQSLAPRPPAVASASASGSGNLAPPTSKPVVVKPLSRAQKLAKALKVCRTKHNRHKRAACETQARKRFGPPAKKSARTTNRRSK
jgi:hypothetical protein